MPTDLSSLSDEQLNVYKDLLAKKLGGGAPKTDDVKKPVFGPTEEEWKNKYESSPFGSTIGKVLDIPYKGAQEFAQGAKDLFTPGSRLHGAHEMFQGAMGATSPITAPIALMNPGTAIPAVLGATAGGAAGKYGAQAFGAGKDVQDIAGDVGSLAGGGVGAKLGPPISAGARAAAPDVTKGALQIGLGELLGKVPGMEWPARIGMGYPGAKSIGKGLTEGARAFGDVFKGPAAQNPMAARLDQVIPEQPQGQIPSIPEPPPQKGPSLGMLREQLKSGVIQPYEFAQKVQSLGYDPETSANIVKQGAMSVAPPPQKFTVGQTPKALSLGHLQDAVKSGLMDIEEFPGELEKLGYNERDRGIITELLKKRIEEEAAAEKEEAAPESNPAPKKEKTSKKETKKNDTEDRSKEIIAEAKKRAADRIKKAKEEDKKLKVESPKRKKPSSSPSE